MRGNKSGPGEIKEREWRTSGGAQPAASSSPHQGRVVTPQTLADSDHEPWDTECRLPLTGSLLFASKQLSRTAPHHSPLHGSVTEASLGDG